MKNRICNKLREVDWPAVLVLTVTLAASSLVIWVLHGSI